MRNSSRRSVAYLFAVVLFILAGLSSAQAQQPQQEQRPPVADISGKWTIFADNVRQPGSSLKTVTIVQNGNIVTGKFVGPHQRGNIQGWINGAHIEFSTDTRDVLTFRGQIQNSNMMGGMYGVHGQHAPWHAERTN